MSCLRSYVGILRSLICMSRLNSSDAESMSKKEFKLDSYAFPMQSSYSESRPEHRMFPIPPLRQRHGSRKATKEDSLIYAGENESQWYDFMTRKNFETSMIEILLRRVRGVRFNRTMEESFGSFPSVRPTGIR